MAVLSVIKLYPELYKMSGSCLYLKAAKVEEHEFGSSEILRVISSMLETLYSYPSGVGLAANQVGIMKQICVVDIKRDAKAPLVLINPTYTSLSEGQHHSSEVCLSFPNIRASACRYDDIEVTYYDVHGKKRSLQASGFKSNVLQHEIDHLNGIVYLDRIVEGTTYETYEGYATRQAHSAIETLITVGNGEKQL